MKGNHFGFSTTTEDASGESLAKADPSGSVFRCSRGRSHDLRKWVGGMEQVPPMAFSSQGQRATSSMVCTGRRKWNALPDR